MSETGINIVGIGNTLMGDDGVGPEVIAALERRGLNGSTRLWDAGLALSDVLGTLDPADPLVIVDAVRTGAQGGAIHSFRYEDALFEPSAGAMLSLHESGVAQALALEAVGGRAFTDVVIFGVEPVEVRWGEGLSDEVARAARRLVEMIIRHVGNLSLAEPADTAARP